MTFKPTHALRHTPEYNCWASLKGRCLNPKNGAYARYGGRGIKVCDRWLTSFENFLEDMGPRPSLLHSIDRIDNDGNYDPSNCRWGTKKNQASNRRNVIYVEGLPLKQHCEKIGVPYKLVHNRIQKFGWSLERALDPKKYSGGFTVAPRKWSRRPKV